MLKSFVALFVSCVAVATAQIALPYGKDMDRYFVPPADTLYFLEEGVDTLPDPKTAAFATAIADWKKNIPGGTISVDTANRLLRFSFASIGLSQRSGDKMVGTKEVIPGFPGVVSFSNWAFDASGRRVSEITGDSADGKVTNLDTIQYTWTHEGCADDVWGNVKRVWSVDANGHCSTGSTFRLVGGVWVDQNIRKTIIWDGDRVSKVFDMDVVGSGYDTIYKDVYTYGTDGTLAKTESFEKLEDGRWLILGSVANTWQDGKFTGGDNAEYDEAGRTISSLKVSVVTTPVGVKNGASRRLRGLTVRSVDAGFEFVNSTAYSTSVVFTNSQGKSIGSLEVAAHGRTMVSKSGNQDVIFWSARSQAGRQSGRLFAGQ